MPGACIQLLPEPICLSGPKMLRRLPKHFTDGTADRTDPLPVAHVERRRSGSESFAPGIRQSNGNGNWEIGRDDWIRTSAVAGASSIHVPSPRGIRERVNTRFSGV